MKVRIMSAHQNICLFNFQGTNYVSQKSNQTRTFDYQIRNCARRGLVDSKISTRVSAPGSSREDPYSKTAAQDLAAEQFGLGRLSRVSGGLERRICARKGSGFAQISAIPGSLFLIDGGGSHWKIYQYSSGTRAGATAAEQFRRWPSNKGVWTVWKHESVREKGQAISKYPLYQG